MKAPDNPDRHPPAIAGQDDGGRHAFSLASLASLVKPLACARPEAAAHILKSSPALANSEGLGRSSTQEIGRWRWPPEIG